MELQQHLDEFEAAGVRVFAISPEPVRRHARFADEFGIAYPLLSDEDSAVIKRYGILNTLIDPDEELYGLPFPGVYLTDTAGRVVQKYFHQHYRTRETAARILRGDLDMPVDLGGHPTVKGRAGVSVTLGAPDLKTYQRVDVVVRLELPEGQHAYGEPAPPGYVPTSVRVSGPEELIVDEATFPPTRPLLVEALNEELYVFEGDIEIRVPVSYPVADARAGDVLPLDVEVRYQACDERQCFIPTTERLRLEAPIGRHYRPERRERPAASVAGEAAGSREQEAT